MLKRLNEGLTDAEHEQAVIESVEYTGKLFGSLKESLREQHNYEIPREMENPLIGVIMSLLTVQCRVIVGLEKKIEAMKEELAFSEKGGRL